MQDYNEQDEKLVTFDDLKLSKEVLKAVHDLGFESPTPIQERSIPVVLEGRDMIGQAQTGTGKTAAFSLPILSKINTKKPYIQALILEPTRELAIQVSEACQSFAKYLKDFHVAPIYGGASYENQIRTLRHGSQVVVATPGRLIDLIERGKVDLSNLSYMVIDEADEMLRMGFIDDVDWILSNTPEDRQTALFSATMPPVIAKIAKQHLTDPEDVRIESKTTTATTVHQRYWIASGAHKIDAMTRILEVEEYDAVIVFVRTKTDAEDVSTRLMGRGFACAALHGDIPQRQREKIIERLKKSQLDIIIATDVAARGLDVDRITHVFNYDIPYDAESYVHRIGRTGRAGRTGEAILFVSPRERRALRMIERVTGQRIEPMQMPSVADVNKARLMNFKNQVLETIEEGGLEMYEEVISELLSDDSIEVETLCAALAKMVQKDGTLLLDESKPEPAMRTFDDEDRSNRRGDSKGHGDRKSLPSSKAAPLRQFPDMNMVRFRVAVGHKDGVKPGQIVGAIANEGNIESKYIGEISIFDTFTTVDLPEGMPHETMEILYKARVCGRALELREYTAEPPRGRSRERSRDFDRQGPRSGRDFKNFEGERKDRRSKGGRPGLKFERGSSRGNGRSFHTSGRREGF
ncbi:MAG: DEAD/DEAH box helicase [Succinivibrio sp.]